MVPILTHGCGKYVFNLSYVSEQSQGIKNILLIYSTLLHIVKMKLTKLLYNFYVMFFVGNHSSREGIFHWNVECHANFRGLINFKTPQSVTSFPVTHEGCELYCSRRVWTDGLDNVSGRFTSRHQDATYHASRAGPSLSVVAWGGWCVAPYLTDLTACHYHRVCITVLYISNGSFSWRVRHRVVCKVIRGSRNV